MELNDILRKEMKSRGFETNKAFAEFLGIRDSSLGRYLKGAEEPGYYKLRKMADALGYELLVPENKNQRKSRIDNSVNLKSTDRELREMLERRPGLSPSDVDILMRLIQKLSATAK